MILVVAVLFTLVVASYTVITHHRSNPFAARGAAYTIVRLVVEILTFLLWIGSAVLALRPHGGCDIEHRSAKDAGEDRCFKHTDTPDPNWKYTEQPLITWDLAIAVSFVEM